MQRADAGLKDDPALLDLLMRHQGAQDEVFQPGPYWRRYSERSARELASAGVGRFRSNPLISKGFVDVPVADPFDVIPTESRTYRFYALLRRLPLVDRHVLERYRQQLRAAFSDYSAVREELYRLKFSHVLKEYGDVLGQMDTLAGDCRVGMTLDGTSISLTHIEQLNRVINLRDAINLDDSERFIEIGGGFGVNAQITLALFPNIKTLLYVDIPPMLYVATQYLKAIFGAENVYDYSRYASERPADLDSLTERVLCLPPWCIAESDFSWDVGWNAASMQEMSDKQVDWYIGRLREARARPSATMALILYMSGNASLTPERFSDLVQGRLQLESVEEKHGATESYRCFAARFVNDES